MIQDSTEIINFLDRTFPDRSLTPLDPNKANEAIEWEEYLDEEIGVTLRLWVLLSRAAGSKSGREVP